MCLKVNTNIEIDRSRRYTFWKVVRKRFDDALVSFYQVGYEWKPGINEPIGTSRVDDNTKYYVDDYEIRGGAIHAYVDYDEAINMKILYDGQPYLARLIEVQVDGTDIYAFGTKGDVCFSKCYLDTSVYLNSAVY